MMMNLLFLSSAVLMMTMMMMMMMAWTTTAAAAEPMSVSFLRASHVERESSPSSSSSSSSLSFYSENDHYRQLDEGTDDATGTDTPTDEETDAPTDEETDAPTDGGGDGDIVNVDDDPWEEGTHVRKEFDDGWWFGVITSYANNVYTVTYEDETTETFGWDSDEIDLIVDNASNYEGYQPGQAVSKQVDGGEWMSGSVTSFENWVYTITWEDGTTEAFDSISEVDDMVDEAADDGDAGTDAPTDDDPWEAGTHVYKEDRLHGTVASYDLATDAYLVNWEDGSTETFFDDSGELDGFVENADNYEGYEPGQAVKKETEGGWISGTITSFDNWVYYITWEDNTKDEYTNIGEVDDLVLAADNGSGTDSPTEDGTDSDTEDGTDAATDEDATDAPTDENINKEQNVANKGGSTPVANELQNNPDDNSPTVPVFGILAGVVVALVGIIFIRRKSVYKSRRRRAELIADEYKDHLELPVMD